MDKQQEMLSISEQESISETVLRMVAQFPEMPKGLVPLWQDMPKKEGIGIFTMQGAAYLSKDILGGFKAQFPFRLLYRSVETGNSEAIASQGILEKLSEWLENMEYPALTDGRKIEEITRKSPVFLAGKDEAGTVFQCNMNLIYRKEG